MSELLTAPNREKYGALKEQIKDRIEKEAGYRVLKMSFVRAGVISFELQKQHPDFILGNISDEIFGFRIQQERDEFALN